MKDPLLDEIRSLMKENDRLNAVARRSERERAARTSNEVHEAMKQPSEMTNEELTGNIATTYVHGSIIRELASRLEAALAQNVLLLRQREEYRDLIDSLTKENREMREFIKCISISCGKEDEQLARDLLASMEKP